MMTLFSGMIHPRFSPKTLIAPALLSATLLGCGNNADLDEYGDPIATDIPHVAVTQIVEHPALDAVRDGVVVLLLARFVFVLELFAPLVPGFREFAVHFAPAGFAGLAQELDVLFPVGAFAL